MHPAPSVILFSVFSGMGFGLLAFLGFGFVQAAGWIAFLWWGLGYGLAVIGLLAASFHLGNPKNALKAFSQWRTSWLSREAWASVATLLLLAPMALSDWLGLGLWRGFGCLGAVLALVTVFTTAMIYTQIKAVPRWNHWITPLIFLGYAVAGALVLSGARGLALPALAILGIILALGWKIGDRRFAEVGATMGSATGLGDLGAVSVFDPAHTAGNYLMREMIFVVGRKHAARLRMIAMVCAVLLPVMALVLVPGLAGIGLAVVLHLIGALAHRWLFFAEAEHVVGLYYGKR